MPWNAPALKRFLGADALSGPVFLADRITKDRSAVREQTKTLRHYPEVGLYLREASANAKFRAILHPVDGVIGHTRCSRLDWPSEGL